MLIKRTLLCLIVIVAAAAFITPLISQGNDQPQELTKLRDEWNRELKQGYHAVNSAYMDDLLKLQKRLERSDESQNLAALKTEIESIQKLSDVPDFKIKIHQWQDRSSVPGIRFARTISQRKMAEMLDRKNANYRRSLQKLRNKFTSNGKKDLVLMIDKALEEVESIARAAREKSNILPSSDQDLKTHLTAH